jgi:hypothetical protein
VSNGVRNFARERAEMDRKKKLRNEIEVELDEFLCLCDQELCREPNLESGLRLANKWMPIMKKRAEMEANGWV